MPLARRWSVVLLVLVLIGGCGGRGGRQAETGRPVAGPSTPAEVELTRRSVERVAAVVPPATPAELVARAGRDPQAILAYIRQHLSVDNYGGALRGPAGTLLAGAGNSVDLMLLMRAAIHVIDPNISVRFMRAPISAPPPARRVAEPPMSPEELAQLSGASVDEVREDTVEASVLTSLQALDAQIKEESQWLERQAAGITQMQSPGVPAEHWWLRAQVGSAWVDLDPVLEPSDPVHAQGVEEQALPEALYHRMAIRLVLERATGNTVTDELLYGHEWRTADISGEIISVALAPESLAPEELLLKLPEAKRFQAEIRAPDGVQWSRVFDLEGAVYRAEGSQFVKQSEAGVSETGRDVERILGGGGTRGAATTRALTGLRLEVDVTAPGEPTRTHRRWIVDRLDREALARGQVVIPPEWVDLTALRLALLTSYRMMPVTGPIGDAMIAQDFTTLALDPHVREAARKFFEEGRAVVPDNLDAAAVIHRLRLAHVVHIAQTFGRRGDVSAVVFARPGMLLYRESLLPSQGGVAFEVAIDVMAPGIVPSAMSSAARYGAALSHGEGLALDASPASTPAGKLAAARQAGTRFRVIRTSGDASTLRWPATARARLAEQVAGGFVALAPDVESRDAAAVAWWRIDPRDGVPVATASNGEGQTASEGVFIIKEYSIPQVRRTGKFIACLIKSVGGGAGVEEANAVCLCKFLGDTLNNSAKKGVDKLAMTRMESASALGPRVALLLKLGSKQLIKETFKATGKPIDQACESLK